MRHEQTFCDGCNVELVDFREQRRITIEQWAPGGTPPERFIACEACAAFIRTIMDATDRRTFDTLHLPPVHDLPAHVKVPEA